MYVVVLTSQVCVAEESLSPARPFARKLYSAKRCANYHRVVPRDFCASIIAKYCKGSVPRFSELNRGMKCLDSVLYVGQYLCTLVTG